MPPVSAPARSMCGPRRLARLALLLLSPLVSIGVGAAPGWGQPASPAGGVTVRAGGEEASVVADPLDKGLYKDVSGYLSTRRTPAITP